MKTTISKTPWKKSRFPRKLKKMMKRNGTWNVTKRLIQLANFGRKLAYKRHFELGFINKLNIDGVITVESIQ